MPMLAIIDTEIGADSATVNDLLPDSSDTNRLNGLIKGVAAGREADLEGLYEETVDRVYGLVMSILRNPSDADEAVIDVYSQIWRIADRYSAGRGTPTAWILMIARSRALDMIRKRRPSVALENQEASNLDPGPRDLLENIESGNQVRTALSSLNTVQREVLSLNFYRDFSHSEIADLLELPLGTVKSHARRALAALRGELEMTTI